jgi:putative oxidoreductase
MMNGINDELILAARLLLATLFLIFGWRKMRDYSGTVSQMLQLGLPMPVLATVISIFMELPVAFAVAIGAFTRPSAALMALYALGTALIGHRYWTVKGADYVDSLEGFYKDLSIIGGFLLLCTTGGQNIRSMLCWALPRHNRREIGPTMQCDVAYVRCRT